MPKCLQKRHNHQHHNDGKRQRAYYHHRSQCLETADYELCGDNSGNNDTPDDHVLIVVYISFPARGDRIDNEHC